ncbi:hypothetical protein QJQ45_000383 [Haematococcus lacustris]|nr:hypothetical protein QJQ45_000383 [Haematococcus lacustris]
MSGNRAIQKTKWNAEEDSHLIRLVHELGEGNWSPIARALNVVLGTLDGGQARTGKQCRERWSHHLKPDLKKGDWNAQEEAWLVSLHQDLGNKWADIARNIEGRSENSVKNHWNAVHRRCCKPNAQQESLSSPLLAYLLTLNLPPAKPKSGKASAQPTGQERGRGAAASPARLQAETSGQQGEGEQEVDGTCHLTPGVSRQEQQQAQGVSLMSPEAEDITSFCQLSAHFRQQQQQQQQRRSLGAPPAFTWLAPGCGAAPCPVGSPLPSLPSAPHPPSTWPALSLALRPGSASLPTPPATPPPPPPPRAAGPPPAPARTSHTGQASPFQQLAQIPVEEGPEAGPLDNVEMLMSLFDTTSSELQEELAYALPDKQQGAEPAPAATPAPSSRPSPPAPSQAAVTLPPQQSDMQGRPTQLAPSHQPQPPAALQQGYSAAQGQACSPLPKTLASSSWLAQHSSSSSSSGVTTMHPQGPPHAWAHGLNPSPPQPHPTHPSPYPLPLPRPAPTQLLDPAADTGLAGLPPIHTQPPGVQGSRRAQQQGATPRGEGLLEELLISPTALLCPVNRQLSQDVQLWWSGLPRGGALLQLPCERQAQGAGPGAGGRQGSEQRVGGAESSTCCPPPPAAADVAGDRLAAEAQVSAGSTVKEVESPPRLATGRRSGSGSGVGREAGGVVAAAAAATRGPVACGCGGADRTRRSETGSAGLVGVKHRMDDDSTGRGGEEEEEEEEGVRRCVKAERSEGQASAGRLSSPGGRLSPAGAPHPHPSPTPPHGGAGSMAQEAGRMPHMPMWDRRSWGHPAGSGPTPFSDVAAGPEAPVFRSATLFHSQGQQLGQQPGAARGSWGSSQGQQLGQALRQPSLHGPLPDTPPLAGRVSAMDLFAWPPGSARAQQRPERMFSNSDLHDGCMMSLGHTLMDSLMDSMDFKGGDPMQLSFMRSGDVLMASNGCKLGRTSAIASGVRGLATAKLPDLTYDYGALQPAISGQIMELHHKKHHQAYITNYNAAIEKYAEDAAPASGELLQLIEARYKSMDAFKAAFSAAAAGVQGSGWGWLGYNKATGGVEIATTANQDPLSTLVGQGQDGCHTPCAVFSSSGSSSGSHIGGYYLDYKNVRPDYLKAIWQVVNWKNVAERLAAAK